MDVVRQFAEEEEEVVNELPQIIEEAEQQHQQEDSQGPIGTSYGISISGTELLFKIDNKTIKKVSLRSMRGFNPSNADNFRSLTHEFKLNGADAAIRKFKS